MLVRVKEYIINNFATCKILCNLQKLHTAFIEKQTPKCNWVLKVVFWLVQKWLTLFALVALIKMLCCQSIQRTQAWHTKTWSRRSFATLRATNASCIGVNPILALQLWKNFVIRNPTNMKMRRNLITASGTLRIEQYWQTLQPLAKNAKRHWLILLMI